jgi:hypothetical protein
MTRKIADDANLGSRATMGVITSPDFFLHLLRSWVTRTSFSVA